MTSNATRCAPGMRIAVFRALMLGDMLCATPALRAVRFRWPDAQITLVGLPWTAALAERLTTVDDFVALPGYPGLPEMPANVHALPVFLQAMQQRHFDLALQLHGSGAIVNTLVASFGARCTAGFGDDSNWLPQEDRERYLVWPQHGHEIERLLALTDHLGCARQGLQLDFPLTTADRAEAHDLLAPLHAGASFAVIHAGSQLASRRWPVERFAVVAQRLQALGLQIVLTGGPGETALVGELQRLLQGRALNLAGRTSLWTLGAVVERARYVVCNDTGVSHIACALGRPSLVLSCGSDVHRWAPLDTDRHHVLWQDAPCRPCAFADCPYGHPCAQALTADEALAHLPDLPRAIHTH